MQQICSFGPPLGWAVQAASVIVTTSLSQSVPGGGEGCQVSLTLGWVQGVDELIGDGILEAA